MEKTELRKLLGQYFQGSLKEHEGLALLWATEHDQAAVMEVFNQMMSEDARLARPVDPEVLKRSLLNVLSTDKQPSLVIPIKSPPLLHRLAGRKIIRWAAAAVIVVAIAAIAVIFSSDRQRKSSRTELAIKTDVKAPVASKAVITLVDGTTVPVDSLQRGLLADQGSVKLVKLDGGQIAYVAADGNLTRELQYNTLTNPRGSQVIDMILSDGSHVWLNAGSSVTYPVAFIDASRKVRITGEAYFEVAPDAGKPFYVTKGDMELKVLGTHFNVNAYEDESDIKVTLLEGSVRVSQMNTPTGQKILQDHEAEKAGKQLKAVTLRPGQQAILSTSTTGVPAPSGQQSKISLANKVDLDAVMAWKNGMFQFNNTDMKAVMMQISRWYDVAVVYEGSVSPKAIYGEMQRELNLSDVVDILKKLGVNCRLEGRKLIVAPDRN